MDNVNVSLEQRLRGIRAETIRQLWQAVLKWAKYTLQKERDFVIAVLQSSKKDRASKAAVTFKICFLHSHDANYYCANTKISLILPLVSTTNALITLIYTLFMSRYLLKKKLDKR